MKISIVQLSDIHLKADEKKNRVLTRAEQIANAVLGLHADVAGCVVIASGDTAYSGKESEYDHAETLYGQILSVISKQLCPRQTFFVMIPGNHDCNFDVKDSTRDIVIGNVKPETLTDPDPIVASLGVQREYKKFADSLETKLPGIEYAALTGWSDTKRLNVDGQELVVNLLNTAWCSNLKERQGDLTFPVGLWENSTSSPECPELVISVLHHPYNWIAAENARALRAALDRRSDLILTGHEHDAAAYSKQSASGEQNEYLEGGVLQDSDDDDASSFNVLTIDTESKTQSLTIFRWASDRYHAEMSAENRPFHRNKKRLVTSFPYSDDFQSWLSDLAAGFKHPRKRELVLADVYIYPDLKEVVYNEEKEATFIQGDDLIRHLIAFRRSIIIGSDTSGKTALAKTLLADVRQHGFMPVFIDGGDFVSHPSKIERAIARQVQDQFGAHQVEPYDQLPKKQRAVIIDDYHMINLNELGKAELLRHLQEHYELVILLAGDEARFEEVQDKKTALFQMKHLEIRELGFRLRSRMIRKWHAIGQEFTVAKQDIDNKVSRTEVQINALLGEQFMPAHPFFVLIALQQLEVQNDIVNSIGSVGHLYEFLVHQSLLASVTNQTNADTNENYLSEFGWKLFTDGAIQMSANEARGWHLTYCKEYRLTFDFEKQWNALMHAELLEDHGGQISFKYPYLYYYFVANYLATHSTEPAIQERIRVLTTYLHQPDIANIMLFLCHLSKNPIILESVMDTADKLFANYASCDFDDDVVFLNKLVGEVSDLALDGKDPEQRRQRLLKNADDANASMGDDANRRLVLSKRTDKLCDLDQLNDQLQLNSALKTIQIIGQILRNHVGSLSGDVKKQLVSKCYSLGLRAAKCLFTVLEGNIDELVDALVEAVQRKQGALPKARRVGESLALRQKPERKEQLRRDISESVYGTLKLGTFAIVKYIADSLGTEHLSETFAEVLESERSMPLELIDVAVKLDHYRGFPVRETESLARSLHKNVFTFSVLRDLVWTKFYLYHVDFRIRQKMSNTLNISAKGQQLITKQGHGKTDSRRPNSRRRK